LVKGRTTLASAYFLRQLKSGRGERIGGTPNVKVDSERSRLRRMFLRRTERQAESIGQPQPLYTSNPADLLYVGNTGNNSITVARHDVHGNAAPLRIIVGPKTGIKNLGQLSEDAQGNLYVAERRR
jgi:hypothetical protein